MKTINYLVIVALSIFMMMTGCQNEDITSVTPDLKSVSLVGSTTPSSTTTVILYAGKTTNVGTLVLSETDTNSDGINDALSAVYTLTGGWLLSEVHLWIGTSLTTMPQTKTGNPQIGQFPYSPSDVAGKSSYAITIPFSSINYTSCQASYFVAAHASVYLGTRTETAWAAGTQMNLKGSWATYFSVTLVDNNPPVITGTLPAVTVEGCSAASAPSAVSNVSGLEALGVSVSDTRTTDQNLVVSSVDVSSGSCPVEVTRTYTVTDACGNSTTVIQKIYVEDSTAPVLSGQGANGTITSPAVPVFTAPVATDECDQQPAVTFNDVTTTGTGSTTVTRTWTATDDCGNSSTVSQSITINNSIVVDNPGGECTSWQSETGFGGNSSGSGSAWWYYYNGTGIQTIWAGQSINVGTVQLVNGTLYITLTSGWQLQNVNEPVKIQGYNTLPSSRPVAGQFTTYKGQSLTVTVSPYSYYVVHLDVRKCTSTN